MFADGAEHGEAREARRGVRPLVGEIKLLEAQEPRRSAVPLVGGADSRDAQEARTVLRK